MQYIDFRYRPPYSKFIDSWMYSVVADGKLAGKGRAYTKEDRNMWGEPFMDSVCERSMDLCLQEMDRIGVRYGVTPARKGFHMTNEELLPLLDKYPDRFLGIACIEPLGGIDKALEEIDTFAVNGPMKGVILEPGLDKYAWHLDDKMWDPIFSKLEEKNVLTLISYGGTCAPDNTYYYPWRVNNIAKRYPNLRMVICHGGWPWAAQMCQIAYEASNVYLSPDVYIFPDSPGSTDYAIAANCLLKDRTVFGSTYPSADPQYAINAWKKAVKEELWENIFYNTAAKLLGVK